MAFGEDGSHPSILYVASAMPSQPCVSPDSPSVQVHACLQESSPSPSGDSETHELDIVTWYFLAVDRDLYPNCRNQTNFRIEIQVFRGRGIFNFSKLTYFYLISCRKIHIGKKKSILSFLPKFLERI